MHQEGSKNKFRTKDKTLSKRRRFRRRIRKSFCCGDASRSGSQSPNPNSNNYSPVKKKTCWSSFINCFVKKCCCCVQKKHRIKKVNSKALCTPDSGVCVCKNPSPVVRELLEFICRVELLADLDTDESKFALNSPGCNSDQGDYEILSKEPLHGILNRTSPDGQKSPDIEGVLILQQKKTILMGERLEEEDTIEESLSPAQRSLEHSQNDILESPKELESFYHAEEVENPPHQMEFLERAKSPPRGKHDLKVLISHENKQIIHEQSVKARSVAVFQASSPVKSIEPSIEIKSSKLVNTKNFPIHTVIVTDEIQTFEKITLTDAKVDVAKMHTTEETFDKVLKTTENEIRNRGHSDEMTFEVTDELEESESNHEQGILEIHEKNMIKIATEEKTKIIVLLQEKNDLELLENLDSENTSESKNSLIDVNETAYCQSYEQVTEIINEKNTTDIIKSNISEDKKTIGNAQKIKLDFKAKEKCSTLKEELYDSKDLEPLQEQNVSEYISARASVTDFEHSEYASPTDISEYHSELWTNHICESIPRAVSPQQSECAPKPVCPIAFQNAQNACFLSENFEECSFINTNSFEHILINLLYNYHSISDLIFTSHEELTLSETQSLLETANLTSKEHFGESYSENHLVRCSSVLSLAEESVLENSEQIEEFARTFIDPKFYDQVKEKLHDLSGLPNGKLGTCQISQSDLQYVSSQVKDLEESLDDSENISDLEVLSVRTISKDSGEEEEQNYGTPLNLASREDSLEFAKDDLDLFESPKGEFELEEITVNLEKDQSIPDPNESSEIIIFDCRILLASAQERIQEKTICLHYIESEEKKFYCKNTILEKELWSLNSYLIIEFEEDQNEFSIFNNEKLIVNIEPSVIKESSELINRKKSTEIQFEIMSDIENRCKEIPTKENGEAMVEQMEVNENEATHISKKRKASIWNSAQQQSTEMDDFQEFYAINRILPEMSSDRYLNFNLRSSGETPLKVNGAEGQAVHLLDVDNPDLWLVNLRSGAIIGSLDEDGSMDSPITEFLGAPQQGRLDSVCTSRQRPTESKKRRDTREQFREEVLSFSNKQQEASLKKRYVVTEMSETEREYQSALQHLEKLLNALTEKYSLKEDPKTYNLSKECCQIIDSMKSCIPTMIAFSEFNQKKFPTSVLDPPSISNNFIKQEELLSYTAFLLHQKRFENFVEISNLQITDINLHFNDPCDPVIPLRQFLNLLAGPKSRLIAYKHSMQDLARYTSRASQKDSTDNLQRAMIEIQQTSRRAIELIELWPIIDNLPKDIGDISIEKLNSPEDIKRQFQSDGIFNIRDSIDQIDDKNISGRIILTNDRLLMLQLNSSRARWNCLDHIKLDKIRIGEEKEKSIELWDLGKEEDSIKKITIITLPNTYSQLAWMEDIKLSLATIMNKSMKDSSLKLSQEIRDAHIKANLAKTPKFAKELELNQELSEKFQMIENDKDEKLELYTAENSTKLNGLCNAEVLPMPSILEDIKSEEIKKLQKKLKENKDFKLSAETKSLVLNEGDTIQLEVAFTTSCSVATEVRWLFNNEPIVEGMGASATLSSSYTKLVISEAKREKHSGTYTCVGKTFDGREASVSLVVNVERSTPSPERPKEEKGTSEIVEKKIAPLQPVIEFLDIPIGKIIELKVEINRIEAAKLANIPVNDKYNPWNNAVIQWFKGEEPLKAGKSCQIYEEDGCSVLRMLTCDTKVDLGGTYTCIMQPPMPNLAAHAASMQVKLHKPTKEELKKGFKPEKQLPIRQLEQKDIKNSVKNFKTGEELSLLCTNPYDNEDISVYTVEWFKDGKKVAGDFSTKLVKDCLSCLTKKKLSVEDAGNYRCILVLKEGDVHTVKIADFKVVVEDKKLPHFPETKQQDFSFMEGGKLLLSSSNCLSLEVLEDFVVIWLKDSKQIAKPFEVTHSAKDNISQISKANLGVEDSGIYECIVKQKLDPKSPPIKLFIGKIKIEPIPEEIPSILEFSIGDTLQLYLNLADNKKEIKWLKDNKKIDTKKYKVDKTKDEKQALLEKPNLTIEDSGLYEAVVSKDVKNVKAGVKTLAKFEVKVSGPKYKQLPEVKDSKTLQKKEGDDLFLTVDLPINKEEACLYEFRWFIDGKELAKNDLKNENACINFEKKKIKSFDEGIYECKGMLINDPTKVTVIAKFKVKVEKDPVETKQETIEEKTQLEQKKLNEQLINESQKPEYSEVEVDKIKKDEKFVDEKKESNKESNEENVNKSLKKEEPVLQQSADLKEDEKLDLKNKDSKEEQLSEVEIKKDKDPQKEKKEVEKLENNKSVKNKDETHFRNEAFEDKLSTDEVDGIVNEKDKIVKNDKNLKTNTNHTEENILQMEIGATREIAEGKKGQTLKMANEPRISSESLFVPLVSEKLTLCGENVNLIVKPVTGIVAVEDIQWKVKKNGQEVWQTLKGQATSRFEISTNREETILSIHETCLSDCGVYECVATVKDSSGEILQTSAKILLTVIPDYNKIKLIVSQLDEKKEIVTKENQPFSIQILNIPQVYDSIVWTAENNTLINSLGVNMSVEKQLIDSEEKVQFDSICAKLTIDHAKVSDSGLYVCTVNYTKPSLSGPPEKGELKIEIPVNIELNEQVSHSPRLTELKSVVTPELENCKELSIVAGDELKLTAVINAMDLFQRDDFEWCLNKQSIKYEESIISHIEPMKNEQVSASIISLEKPAELKDAGEYSLRIKPNAIEKIMEMQLSPEFVKDIPEQELNLSVTKIEELLKNPLISITKVTVKKRAEVKEGPNKTKEKKDFIIRRLCPATLDCYKSEAVRIEFETKLNTSSPLTHEWSFEGVPIQNQFRQDAIEFSSNNYFALTLTSFQPEQAGRYSLKFFDPQTSELIASAHVDVRLDETKAVKEEKPKSIEAEICPMFTKSLKDTTVKSGENVHLECRFVAEPIPKVQWLIDGKDVTFNPRYKVLTTGNLTQLIIQRAQPHDQGFYTCMISNLAGSMQSNADIEIIDESELISQKGSVVSKRGFIKGSPLLTLDNYNVNEINFSWSSLNEGSELVSYIIELRTDKSEFWRPIAENLTSRIYTLPADIASPLNINYIRVLAANSLATGPPSNILEIPVRACIPVMCVEKPLLEEEDASSIKISWNPAVAPNFLRKHQEYNQTMTFEIAPHLHDNSEMLGRLTYHVEAREGLAENWRRVATDLLGTSCIQHLKAGVSTAFRIVASNKYGQSEPSPIAVYKLEKSKLLPDFSYDAPWFSIVQFDSVLAAQAPTARSSVLEAKKAEKSHYQALGTPIPKLPFGLILHWKPAYMPDYCECCLKGLDPIYRVEWRQTRSGVWKTIADDLKNESSLRLPHEVVNALADGSSGPDWTKNLKNDFNGCRRNVIELRVYCRNEYGETGPTRICKLSSNNLIRDALQRAGCLDEKRIAKEEQASIQKMSVCPQDEKLPRLKVSLLAFSPDEGLSLTWQPYVDVGDACVINAHAQTMHRPYCIQKCTQTVLFNCDPYLYADIMKNPLFWEHDHSQSITGNNVVLGESNCFMLDIDAKEYTIYRILAQTYENQQPVWMDAYQYIRMPPKSALRPSKCKSICVKNEYAHNATCHRIIWVPDEKTNFGKVKITSDPLKDWSWSSEENSLQESLSLGKNMTELKYVVETCSATMPKSIWRFIGAVENGEPYFMVKKFYETGSKFYYRVIAENIYGQSEPLESEAVSVLPIVQKLENCICDMRYTLLSSEKVRLIWRLGDEIVDYLEKSPSPRGPRIKLMTDLDVENSDLLDLIMDRVQFVIERKEGYSGVWDEIGDILSGALSRHIDINNPSLSRTDISYRIVAIIDGIRCQPSKHVRIYFKTENLTPDMSIAKPFVDTTNVEAYEIKWPSLSVELFSQHVMEHTSIDTLTNGLCYTIQMLEQNTNTWKTLVDGITEFIWVWQKPDPLLSYSIRIVPHNQFGQGISSRSCRIDQQIVLPDFTYVHPTIREPADILINEEPCDLVWSVPRQYSTNQTLYPCCFEVQVKKLDSNRSVSPERASHGSENIGPDWRVLRTDLKNPRLPLDMLDPLQEYYLRVIAYNDFGRGNPSKPVKKTLSSSTRRRLRNSNSRIQSVGPSQPITLNFVDPQPGCLYAPLGGSFDLRCTIRLSIHDVPVNFNWSVNDNDKVFPSINVNSSKIIGRKTFAVNKSGDTASLNCSNVEESDYGIYTCKASNEFGEAIKNFKVLKADAPVLCEVPPPVITVCLHSPIDLTCIIDAIPSPRIQWTKDSKRLVSSYRTRIGNSSRPCATSPASGLTWPREIEETPIEQCLSINCSLKVEECIYQDAGVYTLIAENIAGSTQCTCLVRVEEKPIPKVIIPRWTNIEEHYYVLRTLGIGEFSYAHLLIDKQTNSEFVGKFYALNEPLRKYSGAQELECLSRLCHNNVVELIDAMVSDNVLILITERLVGKHLLDGVLSCHTWTESAASLIIRQILEGISHVHAEGVVHMDIHPKNLIFAKPLTQSRETRSSSRDLMAALAPISGDASGTGGKSDFGIMSCWIKLIGFSLAQPLVNLGVNDLDSAPKRGVKLPHKCRIDFASPELISAIFTEKNETSDHISKRPHIVGTAADIWNVGIITYLLLTGKHPFLDFLTNTSSKSKISSEKLTFNISINADLNSVSEEAKDFLEQVLQYDAFKRPSAQKCLMHPWIRQNTTSNPSLHSVLTNLSKYSKSEINNMEYLCNDENELVMTKMVELNDQIAHYSTARESRAMSTQPQGSSWSDIPTLRSSFLDVRGISIESDIFKSLNTIRVRKSINAEHSNGSSSSSSLLRIPDEISKMPASSSCRTGIYRSPSLSNTSSLDRRSSKLRSTNPTGSSEIISSEQSKLCLDFKSKGRELEEDLILPIDCDLMAPEERNLVKYKLDQIKNVETDVNSDQKDPEKVKSSLVAPIFASLLKDVCFSTVVGEARFACQLGSPANLPNIDQMIRSGQSETLKEIYGNEMKFFNHGSVAAAWYLDGHLLSDGPGVHLGVATGGWLWLYLQELEHEYAGSIVECVVRNRAGIARTSARLLLAETPKATCRPGVMWIHDSCALVSWAINDLTTTDDLIYRIDVKKMDESSTTYWTPHGYTVDRRYLIKDLKPGLRYRVRISSSNAYGWSNYSVASSEFTMTESASNIADLDRANLEWTLSWRQSSNLYSLSDHAAAVSALLTDKNNENLSKEIIKELELNQGLFSSYEAVKSTFKLERILACGNFSTTYLAKTHEQLVDRGQNEGEDVVSLCYPPRVVIKVSKTDGDLLKESRARREAILLAGLYSSYGGPAGTIEGFGDTSAYIFSTSRHLLPCGFSLGWLANDAVKPTIGLSIMSWVPGGCLFDVLVARGEYSEFQISRWVYQMLLALRWLQNSFPHAATHGAVRPEHILAVRRSSTLPDIMLSGLGDWETTVQMAVERSDQFIAPEIKTRNTITSLSDLWSVGVVVHILITGELPVRSNFPPAMKTLPENAIEKDSKLDESQNSDVSQPNFIVPINVKHLKLFSKPAKKFLANVLQVDAGKRGSIDFWLESKWFSLKSENISRLGSTIVPGSLLRSYYAPNKIEPLHDPSVKLNLF